MKLFWGVSKVRSGESDSFDAKIQDHPDSTGWMDPEWIQGACRNI